MDGRRSYASALSFLPVEQRVVRDMDAAHPLLVGITKSCPPISHYVAEGRLKRSRPTEGECGENQTSSAPSAALLQASGDSTLQPPCLVPLLIARPNEYERRRQRCHQDMVHSIARKAEDVQKNRFTALAMDVKSTTAQLKPRFSADTINIPQSALSRKRRIPFGYGTERNPFDLPACQAVLQSKYSLKKRKEDVLEMRFLR